MVGSSGSRGSLGDWAVIGKDGVLHVAETAGSLQRGRALCGAVGTAFVVSVPPPPAARICPECARLTRRLAVADEG
jgi:hypothetical protein